MAARTGRGNTPVRNVRLDDEVWAAVQHAADEAGCTASDVVRIALAHYLHEGPRTSPLVEAVIALHGRH